MKFKKNKVLNSGIWFIISNFIVRGIGLITTPIFTRLLTKSEFGNFSNFTAWVSILAIIVSLNLEASFIRARFDFEEELDRYVFSMISASFISTVSWYLVVLLFQKQFEILFSMNLIYIHAMFIYLLFYPAVVLFQTAERFKYKYKLIVAISLLIAISTSLLSVVLVTNFNDRLLGRVVGYVIPYIVVGFIIILFYLRQVKKINFKYLRYALPITLPFIPHLLSMFLLSSMDRVMIMQVRGSEETALYSLAYTCGTLISLLVTSINNAYSPWLGEQLSKKNYAKIRRIGTPYAIIFAYIACGITLLTPEVLWVLGGPIYLEAKFVMPPVAAGCILQFLYCMYVNVEQFEKKTVGMAVASVIAATLNFVLNLIFIGKFGYIAAAYTTYIGYLSLLLMHMWLVKKIGMGKVYENEKILMIAGITSISLILSNILFNYDVIRYVVFGAYVLVSVLLAMKNKKIIEGYL